MEPSTTYFFQNDERRYIALSSFGFYQGGILDVKLSNFQIDPGQQESIVSQYFLFSKGQLNSISSSLVCLWIKPPPMLWTLTSTAIKTVVLWRNQRIQYSGVDRLYSFWWIWRICSELFFVLWSFNLFVYIFVPQSVCELFSFLEE